MPSPDVIVAALERRGATLATAESLTGGALCAALVSVPGASAVVRGGIVAYSAAMKARLLGVDRDLIADAGVVSREVAESMAQGARDATGATIGVATTGVAGPEAHDGKVPGHVCIAVAAPGGTWSLTLDLPGDREAVRAATVRAALDAILAALDADVTSP